MKTAEFVSPKHPDKICDYISDLFVTSALKQDPAARIAVETMGGHGEINIAGEVTSTANFDDINQLITEYTGISNIRTNIVKQSFEIAQGVDVGGAGDQGVMVGYATSETDNMMPLEYDLARDLCRTIYNQYPYDGKTQITVDHDDKIVNVIASFQNASTESIKKTISSWLKDKKVGMVQIDINPAGDWNIGGMDSDTGVTGRKIVVDSYGPGVPVGGGAFSGKDPSKVDRSGAYMGRKIATDFIRNGADEAIVYISFGIGLTEPFHAEGIVDGKKVTIEGYDLSPAGIIKSLNLLTQDYASIAKWGHFGNDYEWDRE